MKQSTPLSAIALFAAHALWAGPLSYTKPNLDTTPPGETKSVNFNGASFINKGLVGMGELAIGALDERGDSQGSFSSFKIDSKTWHRNPDGSYGGVLYTLPDRGYNAKGLADYPARIQRFEVTFRPDYGRTNVAQPNLKLAFKSTHTLLDFKGNLTTGLDPDGDTLHGFFPVPVKDGKLTVDAEGLGLCKDGSFYVSEEYGATIYHVDPTGRMLGLITPPTAFLPRFSVPTFKGFTTSDQAVKSQTGGRRDNHGLEGLDLTPDGRYLATMLQSAPRQDCPGDKDANRVYTRLLIYDLTKEATPAKPTEHYLVELPIVSSSGSGKTANKTAAQSEIIALSRTTFLVLARDGNGNGSGKSGYASTAAAVGYAEHPLVYKSILLVSTKGATNLAGTKFESGYDSAVQGTGATLTPAHGLIAAKPVDFISLLNPRQLARFGLDLNVIGASGVALAAKAGHQVGPLSSHSLSAKWEALTIVPCCDPAFPDDYFLLVGNDNDFITQNGIMFGQTYDALSVEAGAEIVENLNRILVYRVTLPGYNAAGR